MTIRIKKYNFFIYYFTRKVADTEAVQKTIFLNKVTVVHIDSKHSSLTIKKLKWRTPPTAMATGYSPALMASNRFPVTSCVTQETSVTQPIHASAQVMSNTCGGHLGGVLTFPPKVAGLAPLVGTRVRTMTGGF